ncbi:MAG TPA: hypothetical protein VM865_08345 [Acidobacteriaceae bacterium]|jgi:hypothetical protein|nr:hypothetical protein [Acidobacteriaceae bacterium]
MRRPLLAVLALAVSLTPACAQRHSGITSPPTAPPPPQAAPLPPEPIVAISSGMGPLQLTQANVVVPAPGTFAGQLRADDESIRAAAFSILGIPAAYLAHGSAPVPHTVQLDFVPLGNTEELDAILTVELDLHLVSAILVPAEGGWRRIANVTYTTAFADPNTNLGTFLRSSRSALEPQHYVAVFHGVNLSPTGDLTESEAHLRVLNDHAVITISFASRERLCEPTRLQGRVPPHECEVTERWMQPQPAEALGNVVLVSATGRVLAHETIDPVTRSHLFDFARGRSYLCQPFLFSEQGSRYEPTANAAPCFTRPGPAPAPGTAPGPGNSPAPQGPPASGPAAFSGRR